MNVRNCRSCGKLFNYITGLPICPACKEAKEAKFQEVKNFVYDNKGATIKEISEACEVEVQQIQQWVREERLVFADDSPISVACDNCGAMIKTGKLCEKCKKELVNQFGSMTKKPEAVQDAKKTREDPKMRFLRN